MIAEDFHFQSREWRVQRFFWFLMAVALFAGIAGLLPDEPSLTKEITVGLDQDYLKTMNLESVQPQPAKTSLTGEKIVFHFLQDPGGGSAIIFRFKPSQPGAVHGLEDMDEIKYAVLEHNGEISIIPKKR